MSRCSGCNHEDCPCCPYFNDSYSLAYETFEEDYNDISGLYDDGEDWHYDDGDDSEL